MTLDKLGPLPTPDVLKQLIQYLGPRSPWLFSLGGAIEVAFQAILEKSAAVKEIETSPASNGSVAPSGNLEPGVWVYTRFWGLTEVLAVNGDKITVAIVDAGGGDQLIRTEISRANLRLTGSGRTF